jgi:hypothetical protein
MKSLHGAGFMLRHKSVAVSKHVKFVNIAIEDTNDPGPFREIDERKILSGEDGTHTIIAAVFAHLKLRWAITACSRHPEKVQYHHGPTNQWGGQTHSEIFGDDLVSEYDADDYPQLTSPPSASPNTLLDTFTGEVKFGIRHISAGEPCGTLPHEVESRALVGGHHEGIGLAQAFSADRKETSKTRCR